MAKAAIRAPISHPKFISDAQMDVANTDATMPRMVFVGPNTRSAIDKESTASRGRANFCSEQLLGGNSRAVGYHQQHPQLEQQRDMDNAAHSDRLISRIFNS